MEVYLFQLSRQISFQSPRKEACGPGLWVGSRDYAGDAAIELGGCKHVCRQLLFNNMDKHGGRQAVLWPSGVGDVRTLEHDCSSGFPRQSQGNTIWEQSRSWQLS